MTEKIRPDHLRRTAYVYVRQSTAHQVRHHRESRQRQYALADRARALGFAETVVIDEDQGKSGSGKQARSGFGHLLTAVCQGQAGAVFALEASRLARNNRDGRIPDFPVTRSHPPASWPSAANSSICRTYRKTAGEESRRRSPVANRWMRP